MVLRFRTLWGAINDSCNSFPTDDERGRLADLQLGNQGTRGDLLGFLVIFGCMGVFHPLAMAFAGTGSAKRIHRDISDMAMAAAAQGWGLRARAPANIGLADEERCAAGELQNEAALPESVAALPRRAPPWPMALDSGPAAASPQARPAHPMALADGPAETPVSAEEMLPMAPAPGQAPTQSTRAETEDNGGAALSQRPAAEPMAMAVERQGHKPDNLFCGGPRRTLAPTRTQGSAAEGQRATTPQAPEAAAADGATHLAAWYRGGAMGDSPR